VGGACCRRSEALHSRTRETTDNRDGARPANDVPRHRTPPTAPCQDEGARHRLCALQAAFPDLRFTIEDIVAEGDRVTTRGTLSGTNTGPLAGLPPTGRPVRVSYTDVLRVADGACVLEHWVELDRPVLMRQLGVLPTEPVVLAGG
jgi:predicted ester cyclase